MGSFGIVLVVLVGIMVLLALIRLGRSIKSTRRMTMGPDHWSTEGAESNPGGLGTHGTHHIAGHHNAAGGHHNVGGHNVGGHIGGHDAGGGGMVGGGHHG